MQFGGGEAQLVDKPDAVEQVAPTTALSPEYVYTPTSEENRAQAREVINAVDLGDTQKAKTELEDIVAGIGKAEDLNSDGVESLPYSEASDYLNRVQAHKKIARFTGADGTVYELPVNREAAADIVSGKQGQYKL